MNIILLDKTRIHIGTELGTWNHQPLKKKLLAQNLKLGSIKTQKWSRQKIWGKLIDSLLDPFGLAFAFALMHAFLLGGLFNNSSIMTLTPAPGLQHVLSKKKNKQVIFFALVCIDKIVKRLS